MLIQIYLLAGHYNVTKCSCDFVHLYVVAASFRGGQCCTNAKFFCQSSFSCTVILPAWPFQNPTKLCRAIVKTTVGLYSGDLSGKKIIAQNYIVMGKENNSARVFVCTRENFFFSFITINYNICQI